jgi:hypothetical protein
MRTTLQLLRVTIGQPQIEPFARSNDGDFDLYEVEMPVPAFRGFPPKWTFAVFDGARAGSRRDDNLLARAKTLIGTLKARPLVVFVSEDPYVRLGQAFEHGAPQNVFFVDDDLLERSESSCPPQLAPFVQAVRRRMQVREVVPYSPYQVESSVTGWQFFGRSQELKEITDRQGNLVVVGARRVGKSSLLKEVERIINNRPGESAYYIDLQNRTDQGDVIDAIVDRVSPKLLKRLDTAKELAQEEKTRKEEEKKKADQKKEEEEKRTSKKRLVDEAEYRHTGVLSVLLERLAKGNQRTTLLLDEIGNVLEKLEPDRWTILGTFRRFASGTNLRIVMSCFQEELAKKIDELKSPLVNFVTIKRLSVFSEADTREMVLSPLEFWSSPDQHAKDSLVNLVLASIGTHPYLLQYFCKALFEPIGQSREASLFNRARRILENRETLYREFSSPVDVIFYNLRWLTLKYLFLKRCLEAHENNQELRQAVIDDDWIEQRLRDVGLQSNDTSRWRLLQSLEMHGLTAATQFDRTRQTIASPLIYLYMRRIEGEKSIEKRLAKLAHEIQGERKEWGLSCV